MSAAQQFLLEAARAAGAGGYFRWNAVGLAVGLTASQSHQAMRSLNDRKLVLLLLEGDARLLDAGRVLAARVAGQTQTQSRRSARVAR